MSYPGARCYTSTATGSPIPVFFRSSQTRAGRTRHNATCGYSARYGHIELRVSWQDMARPDPVTLSPLPQRAVRRRAESRALLASVAVIH